ncbi:hypothetical protein Rumeso_01890 [Rubellimicrobium mesophilum DSM 19309]|uniref:Uncharacterized protein n=1 Tax=Rubellimicrobium mesophilum DSM 19309 TaxID=442562 RepID=A0A017HRT2_9RHOB|nr:hypothetical protein [Rubellimicrobium mesophilum]EYD76469.1 hypothetical protein Rumeso_01890 [Rubellimicrobium mesophilum DSM 19309]
MRLLAAALLALAAHSAAADTTYSDRIATQGLRATEAELAALPSPSPSDRFALGGVRFLAGIERALQLRYDVGLSEGMAVASGVPLLRLPIGENPSPTPFQPGMIDDLFRGVESDMAGAIEALSTIQDTDEVAVEIDTADLWFDIDGNGTRAPGEGVMEIAAWTLAGGFGGLEIPSTTIRFDTADAAWLSAYAHLLSAISDGILAVDVSDAIARVTEARASFEALGLPPPAYDFLFGDDMAETADLVAMFVMAVEGQPDPARTRAARDHLLAVVQDNRRFWSLVPREADNDREWIPNKRQQSATGLPFPPDTGARWLAVLSDAEAVLKGELLIPFWRVGPGAGLDLNALLENPPELDVASMIQGATFVPYLKAGRLADGRNLRFFESLVQGDSALYAVMLN